MSENHQQSPAPPPPRESPTPRVETRPELGVAVSASGSETELRWAWAATVALILLASLMLYAGRSAISPMLDGWLPDLRSAPAESAPAVVQAVDLPPPEKAEPEEPQWTFAEIEQAIRPLPAVTETLIAEGRDELQQFTGLDSRDETQVLLTRNRWALWGRIWHNRVTQIRRQMPPLAECEIHAALQEPCRALAASFAVLDRIPAATGLAEAREHFSEAAWVLDAQYGPPRRDP